MDTIFVRNLIVSGKHGVHDHEWSHEQRFEVDIEVAVDTRRAAKSDDVKDTIDYAHLCAIASTVIKGRSVYLLEKLASIIADTILQDDRIANVSVTIRKPTVLPSGVPGVTIVRTRKDE